MPLLVSFLIRHAAIGFMIGIGSVGGLLFFDAAGLATLIMNSPAGFLPLTILTFAIGLTCGSVQMGFAIMLLTEERAHRIRPNIR